MAGQKIGNSIKKPLNTTVQNIKVKYKLNVFVKVYNCTIYMVNIVAKKSQIFFLPLLSYLRK